MSSIATSVRHAWDWAWPAILMVVTVLAMTAPSPFPGALLPDFVFMLVYLSAAFRHEAFPVWLCFLLGLMADLLSGAPPGMQAITFLAVHAFATSQRFHLRLVQFLWGGFLMLATGAALFHWLLLSAYYEVWLGPEPFIANAAISILVFTVASTPLQWLIGGNRYGGARHS